MAHDADTAAGRESGTGSRAGRRVIVVGLDGSPTSWDAFSWAAGAVARGNGRLVAVYVVPVGHPAAAFAGPLDYAGVEATFTEIAQELEAEAERIALELGVPVTFVVERGDVSRAVSDVARQVHAELVVVGRSANPLHQIAGSLGHRLTRRHDAPVVVVVP